MTLAPLPPNEDQRLKALSEYAILDTEAEDRFDDLMRLAAQICDAPIALVSLIDKDRQWFKSKVGLGARETPRQHAFCAHAILAKEPFCIPDARADSRFANNPLVTGGPRIVFYAGAPLIDPQGFSLGTLCVIDQKPRELQSAQLEALQIIARQVMDQIRLRRELQSQFEARRRIAENENEIIESRNFLTAVLDGIPVAIFCKDVRRDYAYTYWNPKCEEIFGLKASEVIGRTDHDFLPLSTAEFFKSRDKAVMSCDRMVDFAEEAIDVLNLGRRFFHTIKVPIRDRNGKPIYIVGISDDITERKMAEMRLIHASKMSSLGEMAGGVAHEINNPLAIIHGRASQLKAAISSGQVDLEKMLLGLTKIESTANRIAKIVKGLRAFSRNAEHDPYSSYPIAQLLEDALELCRQRFRSCDIDLRVSRVPDLSIECRPAQISQVILNLLNNAYDAVLKLNERWVEINIQATNQAGCSIRVTDSGHGIPHDVAQRILEPFFTTKDVGQGTGLGLSIAKGLVEEHSGRLEYDRTSPNTSFVVNLPLRQNAV